MNKVKINGKEFFVISTAECLVARHNLCVAAEPWGESSWGTGKNGQKILDAVDNRNPESLTYEWFQSLSADVKSAMLTVRVTTDDRNSDGEGVIEQTEMFVPSADDWYCVEEYSQIVYAITNGEKMWTRSLAKSRDGRCLADHTDMFGDITDEEGEIKDDVVMSVVPAFYISDEFLKNYREETVDWVIAVSCSEASGIKLSRFSGSKSEVKNFLVNLVKIDKKNDEENFYNGTETPEDVEDISDSLNAYATYENYHIDYAAKQWVKCNKER